MKKRAVHRSFCLRGLLGSANLRYNGDKTEGWRDSMKKIALLQMEVVAGEKEQNVRHAFELLNDAAPHADILVLPEVWTTGYRLSRLEEQACREGDDLLLALAEFAQQHQKWIVAGSIPTWEGEAIYNRIHCFGPEGLLATYDKVHLFSLLAEPQHFQAGRQRQTVDLAGINTGLSICYDLRFPELYRSLCMDGATLLMVPAEWPRARLFPWVQLNIARALENQAYVCAVNAVGTYRDNVFAGHSALIGPDGADIVRGGDKEDILYGEYDSELLANVRKRMSVWADRREDIYK